MTPTPADGHQLSPIQAWDESSRPSGPEPEPGQAYTAGAAGTFGRLGSTVGRTVGLGTPRQIQLALRLSF